MNNRHVLKLSGEALRNKKSKIFDTKYLHSLANTLKTFITKYPNDKIILIIGGGNIWRGVYKEKIVNSDDSDYMGMISTAINAIYLKNIFNSYNVKTEILGMFSIGNFIKSYTIEQADKWLKINDVLIICCGVGKPGFTTDSAAAMAAINLNCQTILFGKNNVNGVYSSDPIKNKSAKWIAELSYTQLIDQDLKIIDLSCAKKLKNLNIKSIIFNINEPRNVIKIFDNNTNIKYTIITNKKE